MVIDFHSCQDNAHELKDKLERSCNKHCVDGYLWTDRSWLVPELTCNWGCLTSFLGKEANDFVSFFRWQVNTIDSCLTNDIWVVSIDACREASVDPCLSIQVRNHRISSVASNVTLALIVLIEVLLALLNIGPLEFIKVVVPDSIVLELYWRFDTHQVWKVGFVTVCVAFHPLRAFSGIVLVLGVY